jgi:phospholipid/cholesterol/gamma-HCH transport system ATP-binding protein
VVGHDFGEEQLAAFRGRPIDLEGLERMAGRTFHWQGRYSLDLNSRDTICTDLNVFENVAFPLREHTRLPESMVRDLVLMKLHAVGLRGARDLMPSELSGGMARRVALARAIALDPMMVMYDEPFTGQDPISMGVLVSLLRTLTDTLGLTSVVVSHDVNECLSIADYVYVISEGRVVEHGTPDALRRSASAWVQQFLHGHRDGPVPFHYPAPDYGRDLLGEAAP